MANFGGGGGGRGLPRPAPNRAARQAAVRAHVNAVNSGNPKRQQAANAKLAKAGYVDSLGVPQSGTAPKPSRSVRINGKSYRKDSLGVPQGTPASGLARGVGHLGHLVGESMHTSPLLGDLGNKGQARQAAHLQHSLGQGLYDFTGVPSLLHPGRDPLGAGLAAASLLPIGKVGSIIDEARAAEAGIKAAKTAQKGEGAISAFRQGRRALKAARRIEPIANEADRHAYLVEAANRAMEDPAIREQVARLRHESTVKILEPGQVTPETGGEAGRLIRQGLRPDYRGLPEYEKIGAKQDNPGAIELRKQQGELRTAELGKRAAKLREAQKSAQTWDQLVQSGAARAGELPATEFRGFEPLKQGHLENLRQFIQNADLRPYERGRLIDAVNRALAGHTPTEGDQILMERVFGRERANVTSAIKAGGIKNALLGVASIPRAIKSAGDLSWGFRQGLAALAYAPKEFAKAFKGTFHAAASEAEAQARMAAVVHDPYFPLLVKMKVPFTELGSAEHGVWNISSKEEAIMSNYAEHLHDLPGVRHVPGVKQAAKVISKGVRASDRGYVVPLNEIRLGLGSQLLHQALANGWNVEGKLGKDLGSFVGCLTGRGSLPAFLAKHRATINSLFFSPGLMSSRLHMLNPIWYARMEPFARQQATRAAAQLTTTLFVVLKAAQMAGAKVTMDPRNSDFGKIRIGNTRIDIAGGFSQYLTLYSRLASQESISSTTGNMMHLSGTKFGATSDFDLVLNFFLNKLSPVPAEAVALAKQGRFGQPLTPTGELGQMFSPLLWNDMWQLAHGTGPGSGPGMAAALFLPDLFGVGVQNYAPKPPSSRGGSSSFGGWGGGSSSNLGGYGGGGGSSSFGGWGG